MALDAGILQRLTQGSAADAWSFIIERTLDIEWIAPAQSLPQPTASARIDHVSLPPAWRAELLHLSNLGHVRGMQRALDRLAPSHPLEAAQLRDLLESFELDRLQELLREDEVKEQVKEKVEEKVTKKEDHAVTP